MGDYFKSKPLKSIQFKSSNIVAMYQNGVQLWENRGQEIKGYILSYIERTNAQGYPYINTGIMPNDDITVDIDFELLTNATTQSIFGQWISNSYANMRAIMYHNLWYFVNGSGKQVTIANLYEPQRRQITYNNEDNNVIIDGNEVTLNYNVANKGTEPMYLFCCNLGTAQEFSQMKLYSFVITSKTTGNKIQDLLPFEKSDGTICAYDTVTTEYFESQTDGAEFLGGERIGYIGADDLKYNMDGTLMLDDYNVEILDSIESVSDSYIDTGIYPATGITELDFTFDVTNASQSALGCLFGSRGATGSSSLFGTYQGANLGNVRVDFGQVTQAYFPQPSDHIINIKTTNNSFLINDEPYTRTTTETRNRSTLCIFAENINVSTVAYYINGCQFIGENTITENESVVRRFIPIRILETDEICLYDYITQAYFKNLGTGSFIGHSKETPEYAYVEVAEVEGAVSAINAMGVIAEDTVAGQLNQLEELGVDINA